MSKPVISRHETPHGTVGSYTAGFVLSLILTLTAYIMVTEKLAHGWALVLWLSGLAVTQLLVQVIFFLHVGSESKPRWNLHVLVFAAGVVLILVIGSLWIMKNLDYHHGSDRTPEQTEEYLIKDEGYRR